ncbi:hypothetical protein [Paenibacillus sp. HJGM_3]|uniref:hypothetical protein n=1 Tax=Paenibacillus sp. HJGM_3 TaxID=3379816 RepID=UPI003859009B
MQQNMANTTPNRNMLTDKELNYVKDFLSWELLAVKKCEDAANACTDVQIQNKLRQCGQKHVQHYNQLLTHLQ